MWVVKKVRIEDVGFTPHTHCDVALPKALTYSKLPADTAPPIDTILKNGVYEVANGFHRLAAAYIRGDKEVLVSYWES
jgi:hypothetical protein